MKVAVKNLENKDAGEIALDPGVFGVEVRQDILHRMVKWQLDKRQAGTHKTKTISEISGTGKKPWRQKGTGNARSGSRRASQFVGGQTVFGPLPRSHATDLPKKFRKLALKNALSAKVRDGKLVIIDEAKADTHKTKSMVEKFKAMQIEKAIIIDDENSDVNFLRATRNIPHIDILPTRGANVYDILRRDTLVLTKKAVEQLTERLRG